MPLDSSGGSDRRRQQNRDAQRRRRTALKLQIEELQAKNLELQAKNLELQTLKQATTTARGDHGAAFSLHHSKSPMSSSFFDGGGGGGRAATRDAVLDRPSHHLPWHAGEDMASGSAQDLMPAASSRSSLCHANHDRCPSFHDKSMSAVLGAAGHFRNAMGSALGQQPSSGASDKLRLPALSLAGSSSDESTSPIDPGSYVDAASDIVPALDSARPQSPSQSPLSSYFKTNVALDASMPESWAARIRADALPAHDLSWPPPPPPPPGAYGGGHKPTAQATRQRALKIAVANGQVSSVELLLKYGTDLNFIGDTGRTVLHDAAEANDGDMVRVLLGRGADADLMDKTGMTALEVASSLGNLEVAEILLKASMG